MRVQARDREAEAGSALAALAPLEALEEVRLEVGRHAGTGILHCEPKMRVAYVGSDSDRRCTVAVRVDDQIRDDLIEGVAVGLDDEVARDGEVDSVLFACV